MIDENTRKKFLVYAGNDYQGAGGLVDYIERDIIPDFLGGDCMVSRLSGVRTPKELDLRLYLSNDNDGCSFLFPPSCFSVTSQREGWSLNQCTGQRRSWRVRKTVC